MLCYSALLGVPQAESCARLRLPTLRGPALLNSCLALQICVGLCNHYEEGRHRDWCDLYPDSHHLRLLLANEQHDVIAAPAESSSGHSSVVRVEGLQHGHANVHPSVWFKAALAQRAVWSPGAHSGSCRGSFVAECHSSFEWQPSP